MKKLLLIATIFSANFLFAANINKPVTSQYGFIENKGQIIDQNNQLNPSILYLYNGGSLHVHLRQSGFSYEVWKVKSQQSTVSSPQSDVSKNHEPVLFNNSNIKTNSQQLTTDSIFIHRIDISFVNANPNAKIISSQPASDYINYYTTGTSEAGVTNVHHYKKVLYQSIYPNIDVEFILSTNNQQPTTNFKYNFIIHPGGNPNDIQLQFDGANATSLTKDGHITIETAYGNIDESIPYSYQLDEQNNQQIIVANFKPAYQSDGSGAAGRQQTSNIYGITVGTYDATKSLIIDPAPWATYFGGSSADFGSGITTDANGNIFITGNTWSSNAIATSGAYQTSLNGGTGYHSDAFVAKFNSSSSLQWGTYFGGTGDEIGYGIVIDTSGNIIITGSTSSTSSIATTGAYQTTYGGGSGLNDAFIGKFNSSGSRIWSSYFGGSGDDVGYGIAINVNGNIYITGATSSTSGIATSYAFQTTLSGTGGFITKFNSSGTIQWSTYYNGTGYAIVIDTSGNIYVNGFSGSTTGISTTGSYQSVYGGGIMDAFIVKFNSVGARQWASYYGAGGNDYGQGICLDISGNIYISGFTSSTTTIATSGAFQTVIGGGYDAFIAKFNTSGVQQWATYYGGLLDDEATGIASDVNGNVIIIGFTSSANGIATTGAYQTSIGGGISSVDVFIAKFNSTGVRQFATYLGGTNVERGYGITTNNSNVLITGYTNSDSSIATSGAFQTTFGGSGNSDAFIAAFTGTGELIKISNNLISGNQSICKGGMPNTLMGTLPLGGNSTYSYRWIRSTFLPNTGFSNAGGTDNTQNYSSSSIIANTWFRRIVYSGSCIDTSAAILINMKVISGFTVNNYAQCFNGNNFLFNDTSIVVGASLTRKWTFSNNPSDTSVLSNPSKTYLSPGIYSIKLVSTENNGCIDSCIKIVNVTKTIAGFTVNNLIQCVNGNSFSFNDTSSVSNGTLTRLWNFGNGANDSSVSLNPIKIFSSVGTFNVKLLVNGYGCSDSMIKTVFVNSNPLIGFTINKPSQCLNGNNFLFNDTSTISSGTLIRQWNFGTGILDTSSVSNPNKIYSSANVYTVKLVGTSNYGCKDSMIQILTVNANPNTGFTINNISQCLNTNNFIFNDTSTLSSGMLKRIWNFGNGTSDTSTAPSPNKVYFNYGTKNIKLIINNNGCKDSVTKTVTVYPNPLALFAIDNSTQCLNGNNFGFTDYSLIGSGTMQRIWNFGTGNNDTSTIANPTKSYSSANTYSIKIVQTSNLGCKDSTIKTVTIYPNSVVGFTINNASQCLVGNNFLFADTSTINAGNITRLWSFGNGDTSTVINPNKVYTNSNSYAVKLLETSDNGCMDSVIKTVTVNPKPSVGFTINNSSQCINGNNFLLNDSSTISSGTLNSNWDLGNGTNSTVINPSISYSTANTYQVKLISISNNGCKDSLTKTITVNPKPNVGFTQNILSQCLSGNNFVLNDTSNISSGTINRVWSFGDTSTSSISNPNKNYSNAGTYQIKLVTTSNNNCKDSTTKTVTVYTQPKSGFTINTLSQCLIGNSFSFDDTTYSTTTKLWDLGDLTTNTNDTFSKTYNNAGTYNVKLKVNDAHNCSDSTTKIITVKASPAKPIVSAITKSLLQSTSANSYQWYLNNTSITSATNQTLIITSNGSYTVKIDSTNGCTNSSNPFAASAVGIARINISDNEIKIYPNPARDELHIETSGTDKLTAQLFDMTGKEVSEKISFIKSVNFFTESISEGIYFVRVTDENSSIIKTQKVAVVR